MRGICLGFALTGLIGARGAGDGWTGGIFKTTVAASAPKKVALPWLLEYLPVFSAGNSCAGETCECGETGRTELNSTSGFGHEDTFGLHSVLAAGINATREEASGALSLAEVEAIFDQEIGDLSTYASDTYSGFLDYHFAAWAPSLDPYVAKFSAGGVPFLTRRFTDVDQRVYYSLTVHVQGSQLVVELISDVATEPHEGGWVDSGDVRHFFQGREPPFQVEGKLYPLHVSRAANLSSVSTIVQFYKALFDVSPNVDHTTSDGTRFIVFGGSGEATDSFSSDVSLQFVFRPPPTSSSGHTTSWFQSYLLESNQAYMTSYKSCWSIWGDDHVAINYPTTTLDVFTSRLDGITNGSGYHVFQSTDRTGAGYPPNSLYLVDPTGWQVQITAAWPDDPSYLPDADYDTGGFDGYCYDFCVDEPEAEPVVTTPTCTDLLEAECPAAANRCGTCVTKAWPRLRTQPSCTGRGHGELILHCDEMRPSTAASTTADATDDAADDDFLCVGDCMGILKSTWAASDPVNTTLYYLMKYLPVESTPDSCPNQICACGSCGRTQMIPNSNKFGLHTVAAKGLNDCRATSPLTGDLTVADVEAIFDEELGDMSVYSPFMDYNAMMWAPAGTLDSYREAFDADGVPTHKLQWPCFAADSTSPADETAKAVEVAMCYSLIMHIPQSMVNIEIASNETSAPDDFSSEAFPRHEFVDRELPQHDYMEPLHDSRAVDDIDAVIDFWDRVLDMKPTAVREGAGSSVTAVFAFASSDMMGHDANVQYVYRPQSAQTGQSEGGTAQSTSTSTSTSISWLQSYWNGVADKYMTNASSMWPVWGDNHLALVDDSAGTSIDAVIERLDAIGDTLYHPFLGIENGYVGPDGDWFGHTALYIQDPSGFQVEYHAPFNDPGRFGSLDVDKGDFNEYCDYRCS